MLLLLLAFKVSYFIVENYQLITDTKISFLLEVEDDFENESEEKQELDENKKINQTSINTSFTANLNSKETHIDLPKNHRNFYFEFITPPPELS